MNKLHTPPKDWMEPATFYKTALGNDWYKDLALIQSEIVNLTFDFFKSKELKTVCLPATTGSVTSPMGLGSDSLPVKINLEGTETYLADSMQFHLEYMLRFLNNGVHYIMPTFRGESADARHLCQFYHSEAEIIGNLSDVINLVEEYIKYMCESLLENNRNLLLKFTENLNHIENLLLILHSSNHFPQITVKEAAVLLEDNPKYVNKSELGFITITNEGEAKLIEHFNGIVWLTHHDYKSVPFYQAKDKKTSTALNADLLFGIGEVVGCGERHHNIENLKEAYTELNVNPLEYEWYTHMKKEKPLQTSGFGMGMERFILFLINHDDIRDTQIIPRFNGIIFNP